MIEPKTPQDLWKLRDENIAALVANGYVSTANIIRDAVCYWWTEETMRIALSLPLPPIDPPQPFDRMWMAFPAGIIDDLDHEVSAFVLDKPGPNEPRATGPEAEAIDKLLAFLNTPLAKVHRKEPKKSVLRKMVSQSKPVAETIWVRLRKPQTVYPEHQKTINTVDWQYQWLVGGHWRNQYYPGDGSHKLIWIEPYLKGPDDKPLKLSAYRVER